ncbi:MAG: NUDIX domain-containing protein [bacterium]|nr:NUDIX domain-containing protein [bacterium]
MSPRAAKKHPSKQAVKVAVDNCIFTVINGELNILLIQMKKQPFASVWALPGGLIFDDEPLDVAAKRILQEQTGVSNVYLEQLFTFGDAARDPFGRVVSVAYMALIPSASVGLQVSEKYGGVRWWPFHRLPKLAYDHNSIAAYGKQRLEWKVEYTNVAWSLLPSQFVLTELQTVYEAILGRELDKRNFRKKILKLKLIEPVGKRVAKGAHRPAMLYRFRTRTPKIVEIL